MTVSKPRPYRVYKRLIGISRYVGCFASREAAEREARILGGYVLVLSAPITITMAASAAASLSPTGTL